MVTSITPGAASAPSLGTEARAPRPQLSLQPRGDGAIANDAVTVSDAAAAWTSAKSSVSDGLSALDLALAAGREALLHLNEIGEAARSGGDAQAAIDAYQAALDDAQSPLLSGEDLLVDAEPGANAVRVPGFDARLGAGVGVPADASSLSAAALARAAQDGAAALQKHLNDLDAAASALEAHAGFLDAAQGAGRADIDADGARLLALQVKQGLAGSGAAIANAQPQAVLSLFKA